LALDSKLSEIFKQMKEKTKKEVKKVVEKTKNQKLRILDFIECIFEASSPYSFQIISPLIQLYANNFSEKDSFYLRLGNILQKNFKYTRQVPSEEIEFLKKDFVLIWELIDQVNTKKKTTSLKFCLLQFIITSNF